MADTDSSSWILHDCPSFTIHTNNNLYWLYQEATGGL